MVTPEPDGAAPERWPDFYLVGAPRCGTTSLFEALKEHPGLFLPLHKEPQFFDVDLSVQPHSVRDRDLYLGLFASARADQRVGEGSVWYLHSERAAEEIAARRPDARVLIILRDPTQMIRSLHALYLRTGNEDIADLGAALDAEPERRAGRRLPPGVYFPEGLLYTQVAQWSAGVGRFQRVFGRERVRVVLLPELIADREGTLDGVLRFLGVDPALRRRGPPGPDERAAAVRELRRLRALSPAVFEIVRRRQRRDSHLGAKPSFDPSLRGRIIEQVAGDVRRLEALIGADLSAWTSA